MLFTDIGLPGGMDGRELAKAALARKPGLKVLFMSGYIRDETPVSNPPALRAPLLAKPFAFAGLAGKIRECLDDG